MTKKEAFEQNPAIAKAIRPLPEAATITLPPLPASSTSRAALRRCRAAWKRAIDRCIKQESIHSAPDRDSLLRTAAPVYCAAMPALDSTEGLRDFIACTAHGILIGAIPKKRAGQLLQSAQTALRTLQLEAKKAKCKTRTPSPPRTVGPNPSRI